MAQSRILLRGAIPVRQPRVCGEFEIHLIVAAIAGAYFKFTTLAYCRLPHDNCTEFIGSDNQHLESTLGSMCLRMFYNDVAPWVIADSTNSRATRP
jgi:hypothetical protein